MRRGVAFRRAPANCWAFLNCVGAALIAYQLYSHLAIWANRGYEEELKADLNEAAELVSSSTILSGVFLDNVINNSNNNNMIIQRFICVFILLTISVDTMTTVLRIENKFKFNWKLL